MSASEPGFDELMELAASADPAEVDRAHELAVRRMRAEPRLQLVAATAYDRTRVLAGRPQKFGTQVIEQRGRLIPWPVDAATTDTERAKWGVATLARLAERVADAPRVEKATLRSALRRRRAALPETDRSHAREVVAAVGVAELVARCAGAVVAAYWPVGSELDPRALARGLREQHGVALALPSIEGDDMTFRRWDRDEDLVPVGFGTFGPPASAPEVRPDVVLAPLLGCDRRGGRLGQGKGYYDRALERLDGAGPIFVVGVAFDVQVLPAVPTEKHDRALDAVLTERGWIALSG